MEGKICKRRWKRKEEIREEKKTQFIIHVDIFHQGKRVYDQKWMIWNGWRTFGALCILSSTKIIHLNWKINTEKWKLKSMDGMSVVIGSVQIKGTLTRIYSIKFI